MNVKELKKYHAFALIKDDGIYNFFISDEKKFSASSKSKYMMRAINSAIRKYKKLKKIK